MGTNENAYRPPGIVVLGHRVLAAGEKLLPSQVYRPFRNATYGIYRGLIRQVYRRRWAEGLLKGEGELRRKSELVYKVMPYSLVGWRGLEATYDCVARIQKDGIEGAIVECGVARGGSAALMGVLSASEKKHRKLWLFDSYEGLPDPTDQDFEGGRTGKHIRALPKGSCLGTYEEVERLLFEEFKLERSDVKMVKGWFQDTLPKKRDEIGAIAVLRLDGDWYESTKCCFESLFDNVVSGGAVIIDDYGSCFGAQRATDEFLKKQKLTVELHPDGRGGCYFFRP